MISFEKFLLSNGYVKHSWNYDKKQLEPATGFHVISTLANLGYWYVKLDRVISIGLNQKGKGVTIISPRPKIKKLSYNEIEYSDGKAIINAPANIFDENMSAVMVKYSDEEILNAIYSPSTELVID